MRGREKCGVLAAGGLEPKAGLVHSHMRLHEIPFLNHKLKISQGFLAKESSNLLSNFFKCKRGISFAMI